MIEDNGKLNGGLGFAHRFRHHATPEEEALVTPAYISLEKMLAAAIEHIRVVGSQYVSSVTLQANLDIDGNISKEETGITITIHSR